MSISELINVRELLRDSSSFGATEVDLLTQAIVGNQTAEARQEVESLRVELDESNVPDSFTLRVGVGLYLLGQHQRADRYLANASGESIASFYHALVLSALGQPAAAERKFQEAASLGYDSVDCTLRQAGEIRLDGRVDESETLLRSAASEGATRAEYSYQMGCILADQGDTFGAVEYFERAIDMDPHHSRALFSLAGENGLHGNDDEAIRLYERSLSKPPQYLGALLNLGLLYEDAENYPAAAYCFRRILDVVPDHEQAALYLKDIEATNDMYYDEESARDESRLQQLLSRPVTDFELTVRSRNCLEGIDINTLGDLTHVTEQELLSGKNFGETSLIEIRELMTAHGLRIGQNLHATATREPAYQQLDLSPEEQAMLEKPISELNFSVRARKCMSRLGITQVGELTRRTADELLGSKNFGVTSLNEVRLKLDEIEMKLRND